MGARYCSKSQSLSPIHEGSTNQHFTSCGIGISSFTNAASPECRVRCCRALYHGSKCRVRCTTHGSTPCSTCRQWTGCRLWCRRSLPGFSERPMHTRIIMPVLAWRHRRWDSAAGETARHKGAVQAVIHRGPVAASRCTRMSTSCCVAVARTIPANSGRRPMSVLLSGLPGLLHRWPAGLRAPARCLAHDRLT